MSWLQVINTYWSLIAFIGGVIFYALWTYFKVGNHEIRIMKLETDNTTINSTVNEINTKISSIDAKLDILLDGYHKTN